MRQPIHPRWNFLTAQNLCQRTGEMIAIVVHQMVSIATKLIPNLFYNSSNFVFVEISTADLNTLSIVTMEHNLNKGQEFNFSFWC